MRWKLVVAGVIVLILLLVGVVLPKLHYVDPKPAVAYGEEYYSELKLRRADDAFAMYTDGFIQKRGDEWHRLLADIDGQSGGVTDFKTVSWKLAPVHLRDSTELACVLVQYHVTRNTLDSQEILTVCPHQHGSDWGIAGHEITRSDTGQHYAAGLTIREETIFSTK